MKFFLLILEENCGSTYGEQNTICQDLQEHGGSADVWRDLLSLVLTMKATEIREVMKACEYIHAV